MAEGGIQLDQDKLCCSICLDLLKDPVTIPCGHSYCMSCINGHWDEEDQKKIYSCPQCRQSLVWRPILVKNTMLAALVEELKKTGLQAAPAEDCYAGPEDVACDFCTGRKRKALRSCLQCLVSYCEQHLQPHYESPAFEKHKLVDTSRKLQESICARHNEVMKVFCRTDQQCICYLCSMEEHKGHDAVSAAAETAEKQRQLEASRQKIQQRIQDREKDLKALQQEVEDVGRSADNAVRESDEIFADLVLLIAKRNSDVRQSIRSHQQREEKRVRELQEKLKQEIADLERRDTEWEQLSRTEGDTQFLQKYPSLAHLADSRESPSISTSPVQCFEDVTAAVTQARDKLQSILSDLCTKILVKEIVDLLLKQAGPNTRTGFLQYSQQLTLRTENEDLLLSDGNRKATVKAQSEVCAMAAFLLLHSRQPCPFYSFQALSRESLTGRRYWEVVQWGVVSVGVTYTHASRTGYESGFGNNNKSWALYCFKNDYEFRHNDIRTSVSGPKSSRVGVYLDHSAGILSFYSVSKTMTLLHRVQTTFTQPLYAGLGFFYGSTAELE